MTRKFFGTDGIRGTANSEPMTSDVALKVGMAAGSYFSNGKHRHRVVIGKDTRLSGYMLEPALTSGFVSVGMNVILVGPMPTPAVSMLTRSLRADLGVMLSASHNPFEDNGIKLFDKDGIKLSDEVEKEIEKRMKGEIEIKLAQADMLGRAKRLDDAPGRYIEFIKHTVPKGIRLTGLKVVLDCANGAAYHLGKTILWELGAEVIALGVEPNGFNINDKCGSTHPENMCQEVLKQGADIGIALDGDADRVIMCDEKGKLIDGDQLLGLITKHQYDLNNLKGNGIVVTSMSNIGLEKYVNALGLEMKRTKVGDRYVSEYMRKKGYNVGGEQSGHIILRDYSTTGDGLLAALQVLSILIEKQKPASEVCRVFKPFPQLLRNVKFGKKNPLESQKVKDIIKSCEKEIGKKGRLVIRKSGTEPLVRVMAEGENPEEVKNIVDTIVSAVEQAV